MLWRLSAGDSTKCQPPRASLEWSINIMVQDLSEGISNLVLLDFGLVLVAGDKGSISIIDTAHCTHKAFSTQVTPQLIQSWHLPSLRSIRPYIESSSYYEWMGIRNIYTHFEDTSGLWKRFNPPRTSVQDTNLADLVYPCTLVTFGGWIIIMNMHIIKQGQSFNISLSHLDVIHKSPKAMNARYFESGDGDADVFPSGKPSIPDFFSPALMISLSSSIICIAEVKQTISIIADTDGRVLFPSQRSIYDRTSQRDGLLFIQCDRNHPPDQVHYESKTNLQAFPIAMDMHPNKEWMIVGVLDKNSGESHLVLLRNIR